MRDYCANKGDEALRRFEVLKPMIVGAAAENYEGLSKQLGISADSLRVQVHRLRHRYRDFLRNEIAGTIASEDDVDDEIRRLFELMAD